MCRPYKRTQARLPREILQGGQDCFGVPGQAETSLKIEDLDPIKPLVNFHECFISFVAECLDNIMLITYPLYKAVTIHNSEV
jgi:hypothetical protein